ncbi:MAG: nucleoside hydrolase [Lachnospiraceae bacterium]|nr:nucleoside hydrolase [Lachnospiraceae bacterium]
MKGANKYWLPIAELDKYRAFPTLGGQEFNLGNDIAAANTVFESNIELWQVPKNVYEMMAISLSEIEYKISDCGEIGEYLLKQLNDHAHEEGPRKSAFRTG